MKTVSVVSNTFQGYCLRWSRDETKHVITVSIREGSSYNKATTTYVGKNRELHAKEDFDSQLAALRFTDGI